MIDPIITARGVDVFYDTNHAVHNVDLDILPNKGTAFIGPSGCGKSTFLHAINRMNDLIPSCRITGEMKIGGQGIYAPKAAWCSKNPIRSPNRSLKTSLTD